MSRDLFLAPDAADALATLWGRTPQLADRIENALDWIEADPPDVRSLRRIFTNGIRAITVHGNGETWVILWEEQESGRPRVRALVEETSI